MPEGASESWDVVVVGSGNAGLSAALTARALGASVLVIDAAPEEWIGGNSAFTAGAFRTTYDGLDDLRPVLDLDDATAATIELGPYTPDDFHADIQRMAGGRSDEELTRILAGEAADAVRWLHGQGVAWELLYARQAFTIEGRTRFWGNLTAGIVGGGIGLIDTEARKAREAGVELRF
jgi:tricarballylate dehydrogenase